MSMERFWAKVDKGEGCWEWRGWTDPKGYGRIQARDGRPREEYVHRLVYAMRPIPAGPRRPSTCVHGHPFDVLNTYVGLDGKRKCRRCRRENGQRRRVA